MPSDGATGHEPPRPWHPAPQTLQAGGQVAADGPTSTNPVAPHDRVPSRRSLAISLRGD